MFNPFLPKRHQLFSLLHHSGWMSLFAVITTVLLLCKVMPAHTPTIATVDVTSIVRQFVRSEAQFNLSNKELQQRVRVFGHQLETTLNVIAKERHVVLMPQEAVMAGAMDLTPLVKQRLVFDAPSTSNKELW